MVEVICDTSFLIHLATKRIKNFDFLDSEIGSITFVVPTVVKNELINLKKIHKKNADVISTLNYIKNFKTLSMPGTFADDELIKYAKNHHVFIATIDKNLKKNIKLLGSSIISIHNEKIILEN